MGLHPCQMLSTPWQTAPGRCGSRFLGGPVYELQGYGAVGVIAPTSSFVMIMRRASMLKMMAFSRMNTDEGDGVGICADLPTSSVLLLEGQDTHAGRMCFRGHAQASDMLQSEAH